MTITHTITRDAFNTWHAANAQRAMEQAAFEHDRDDDGDAWDKLMYYLRDETSGNTEWWAMLNANGLTVTDDSVTFTMEGLDAITPVAEAVSEEYEDSEDQPTWNKYGLSGDDDVDYYGGYLTMAFDVMRLCVATE